MQRHRTKRAKTGHETVARRGKKPPRRVPIATSTGDLALGQSGDPRSLQAIVHELHDQRATLRDAQAALERSRNRYAELFDFAPVGYVVLDEQGVIENVNLTAAQMLGVGRVYASGLPFMLFVAETEHRTLMAHLRACREHGGAETACHMRPRSRAPFPVRLASRASAHGRGPGLSFYTAIIDLSEQERAAVERERIVRERESAASEKEAKDRFIAQLSHELRTPLTPVLLALGTLERSSLLPESLRPRVEMIRRNILHEKRLIDDLLDVTRIARGTLALTLDTVDLHQLVNDVVERCTEPARRAQVDLVVLLEARGHHVNGDATRLRQVVLNLLDNAIRSAPGGRVIVHSSDTATGVRLSVRDTGVGIPADLLPHIFRPFEQGPAGRAPRGGLGLGLTISAGIVEAHHGTIDAASPGTEQGATFTVELPTAAPAETSEPQSPIVTPVRPLHVLVVEDDQDTGTAVREILRMHGHHVILATTLREALAVPSNDFELVVSDIGLPDGTGFELMAALRNGRASVRGIALSGYGTEGDRRDSRSAGFDCHLTKPVDPAQLLEELGRLTA